MKRSLAIALGLMVMPVLLPTTASACTCISYLESDEAMINFYKNKFDGAAFTGTVKSIREVPGFPEDEANRELREMIVDVDQFWIGVPDREMKIYTDSGRTSCSVNFEKDKKYFFLPSMRNGRLISGMCDFSNWKGRYPDKEWSDFIGRVWGPAKSFPKSN